MKSQILKIAGVKSEKEFYKKYPSEEAFMKKHGKEFKKAQTGVAINASQVRQPAFKPLSYQDQFNDVDKMLTGSTAAQRQELALKQQATASQGGGGGGFDIAGLMKLAGGAMQGGEGMGAMGGAASGAGAGAAAAARYGRDIPKANYGDAMQSADMAEMSDSNTWSKIGGAINKYAGPVGDVISGIGELKKEKEARKAAEQARDVSKVSLKAAESIDVDARRQQSENIAKQREAQMPVNTGEEFFPIYGVGTNVLARNGLRLQGGGEIQNTYDPYDIYEDSGYEPLNDSNVKQYYHGGRLHKMQDGGGTPWGAIGQKATGIGQSLMGGQNAGGKIGGTIGSSIGNAIVPGLGGAIGGFVGGIAGNALDTNAKKMKKAQDATQRNMQAMANANMAKGIQAQNQSYMKDGGWVSNDWTPQVIASFGGLDEQEVYDYAHEGMDTLRAGGHLRDYTPPSDRAMEIYEDGGEIESYGLGGQLKTHWGGEAETISHNPYLPGSGETVAFRGQSHTESDGNGQTGIGITYGDNPVEVERGEPMFEMQSGGEVDPETGEPQNTGVVFGNMQVDKNIAKQFKDPELMAIADKYHGKKFKNIGLDLSKDEAKQNKIIDKTTSELESLKVNTPFDKLKLSALRANLEGADRKLKQLANSKIILANYQNAINDAKEEISEGVGKNISAEDLSRGYVKLDKDPVTRNARDGKKISKAQDGKEVDDKEIVNQISDEELDKMFNTQSSSILNNALDEVVIRPKKSLQVEPEERQSYMWGDESGQIEEEDDMFDYYMGDDESDTPSNVKKSPRYGKDKDWWKKVMMGANAALPYFRPSDQESLDMAQLYPEMFAMATNQEEPVPAQLYHPDLSVPYDISRTSAKNDLIAQTRAAQRQVGYNPAMQAAIAAQAYEPMQKLNEADFIANQEMRNRIYSGNVDKLNQAKITNQAITADQWNKQALAKANTKATTQAALNSIADKYAKNKLENRTLGIYENLYNYRFGKSGRAQSFNPFQLFDTTVSGGKEKSSQEMPGYKATSYDKDGNVLTWKKVSGSDDDDEVDSALTDLKGMVKDKKNGGDIKKNYKNSSVVRAYKNI